MKIKIISNPQVDLKHKFFIGLFLSLFSFGHAKAEVHPVLLSDEQEMYSKVYFGMQYEEFKSKLAKNIFECKDSPNKTIADVGCKISFRFAGSGISEALCMFKQNKLIAFIGKINSDFYNTVSLELSKKYKDLPRLDDREEKKGLFSKKINNQYSSWIYPQYLMILSKYDSAKYQQDGVNFSMAVESSDENFIELMKTQSKKKSNLELNSKAANVDFDKLHIQETLTTQIVDSTQSPSAIVTKSVDTSPPPNPIAIKSADAAPPTKMVESTGPNQISSDNGNSIASPSTPAIQGNESVNKSESIKPIDKSPASSGPCGELNENHTDVEKNIMSRMLKDPYSAKIQPVKIVCTTMKKQKLFETINYPVWISFISVNAKNSFGGYTGEKPFAFAWYKDEIVYIGTPVRLNDGRFELGWEMTGSWKN